uniref:Uncharacterized protein n=2 Tax=Talaromyces marneffei PM1 TaxID=1077442 RepID=A0A093UXZ2_TALMA
MTEEERVFLPSKISEKWGEIQVDIFKEIAEGLSKGTSLTAVNGDSCRVQYFLDDISHLNRPGTSQPPQSIPRNNNQMPRAFGSDHINRPGFQLHRQQSLLNSVEALFE